MSESESKKPRLDLDGDKEPGTSTEISESNVMELPRDEETEGPSEPSSSASTPQPSDLPR